MIKGQTSSRRKGRLWRKKARLVLGRAIREAAHETMIKYLIHKGKEDIE